MSLKNISLILIVLVATLLLSCSKASDSNPNSNFPSQESGANTAVNVNANRPVQTPTPVYNSEENRSDLEDFEGTTGVTNKESGANGTTLLKKIRTGVHNNFDRIVFEFEGARLPGYQIEYFDKPPQQCGSGYLTETKGKAWLQVRFTGATAHEIKYQTIVALADLSPNMRIVKEIQSICDFEGIVEWVISVSSPNKYRVLELTNPTRLAVDIKH